MKTIYILLLVGLFTFNLGCNSDDKTAQGEMNHSQMNEMDHETTSEEMDHSQVNDHDHAAMMMEMEESDSPEFTDESIYQVESSWKTQDNESIALGDLSGKYRVVAMAYTSCKVACPLIVASMQSIEAHLGKMENKPEFVFVSIDPTVDTPAVLKEYAGRMNLNPETWTLLNGDQGDVLELAALLGIRYKKMPDGEYAHSSFITVLNEEGEVVHQQRGTDTDLTAQTVAMIKNML